MITGDEMVDDERDLLERARKDIERVLVFRRNRPIPDDPATARLSGWHEAAITAALNLLNEALG